MRYLSTRGTAPATTLSAALTAGLAPDGGLYLPESWPVFDDLGQPEWSLPKLAEHMLAPFFAMLSGQLAKHEYREEENLFPHWKRFMKNVESEADELFRIAREQIGDVR